MIFSHFVPSIQKVIRNVNFTPDSKTTLFSKRRYFSFGVRGKIDITLEFSERNEQSERKSNFDTPNIYWLSLLNHFKLPPHLQCLP